MGCQPRSRRNIAHTHPLPPFLTPISSLPAGIVRVLCCWQPFLSPLGIPLSQQRSAHQRQWRTPGDMGDKHCINTIIGCQSMFHVTTTAHQFKFILASACIALPWPSLLMPIHLAIPINAHSLGFPYQCPLTWPSLSMPTHLAFPINAHLLGFPYYCPLTWLSLLMPTYLALLGRDGGVPVNELGEHTSQSLNPKGQWSDIQQQHIRHTT